MRASVLALLLLPLAGCISGSPSEQFADEHLADIQALTVRIGNETDSIDIESEDGRALARETLVALSEPGCANRERFRPDARARLLEEASYLRLVLEDGSHYTLPETCYGEKAYSVTDILFVWEPRGIIGGNMVLGGVWSTSYEVEQLRDMAVEVLHRQAAAPSS